MTLSRSGVGVSTIGEARSIELDQDIQALLVSRGWKQHGKTYYPPNAWMEKTPTKPGLYWFYGWRFGTLKTMGVINNACLHVVRVWKGTNKNLLYDCDGALMDATDARGKWREIVAPDLPELEEPKAL